MALRLAWLVRARDDLQAIHDHVGADDPGSAHRLVLRLFEASRLLTTYPEIGRAGRVAGTREWVVPGTRYILAYRVRGDAVQVLAALHAARAWPDRF